MLDDVFGSASTKTPPTGEVIMNANDFLVSFLFKLKLIKLSSFISYE
jgi:hypothetical protein